MRKFLPTRDINKWLDIQRFFENLASETTDGFKMRTILITGGAGFIGANLVHFLAVRYPLDRIIVLDALTYAGTIENLPPEMVHSHDSRLRLWYGNVCNAALVDTLVEDADVVIHLAAETHVTRSIFDSLQFFQTDVLGTQTVANAVVKFGHKVQRFIHISSSEVYGSADAQAMNEDHPLNPMSPYAGAKCGADRLIYSYWATYKIPVVIIRPFNNFGPMQHLEKLVPRFITSALLNETLTVHGTGDAARDFVYVEDTCRAIDLVLRAPGELVNGEVFNVASGEHRSIVEIAHDITAKMDYSRDRIEFIGDRPGQVVRHTGDWSKINRVLGWAPTLTWNEGLSRTIEWYRENTERWSRQLFLRKIPITTAEGKKEFH
jgi:dTDP-glucose 4,6-dehydratase